MAKKHLGQFFHYIFRNFSNFIRRQKSVHVNFEENIFYLALSFCDLGNMLSHVEKYTTLSNFQNGNFYARSLAEPLPALACKRSLTLTNHLECKI